MGIKVWVSLARRAWYDSVQSIDSIYMEYLEKVGS